jgi:exportin-T
MQKVAEDVSDPANQKVAITFFNRCVTIWGQPVSDSSEALSVDQRGKNEGLPGFEHFIYERLIPTAFRVPSLPNFNPKDGQMTVVRPYAITV